MKSLQTELSETQTAAALSEATEEHKAAASAQQEQMQAEHQDRVSSLETKLESLKTEHSSAASSHAEAVSEMTSAHEQRIAELESAREADGKESEAAESALRSEMDELRLELESLRELHAASVVVAPMHTLAVTQQAQMEHRDRLATLETDLDTLKTGHVTACNSLQDTIESLQALVPQSHHHRAESASAMARSLQQVEEDSAGKCVSLDHTCLLYTSPSPRDS